MWGQVLQGGMALAGAIGGGKGSKSSSGTPKFVKRQLKKGYAGLNEAVARSPTEAIAGLNADQTRGFDMVRGNIGLGAGSIQEALDKFRSASGGVTPEGISKFMNPYTTEVIDASVGDIERARGRAMLGINAEAEAAKAFGGDREAVLKALTAEDFNRNIASTSSGLRFNGWNSAVDSAFRDNASSVGAAGGLLNAVDSQRKAAYGDAAAVTGVGNVIRDYDQSLLDYPLKVAQMQIDAAGTGMGVTPNQRTGGGISGAMAGLAGGAQTGSQVFDVLKGIFGGGG